MATLCDLCAEPLETDEAETCSDCGATFCCTCGALAVFEPFDESHDVWLCNGCLDRIVAASALPEATP